MDMRFSTFKYAELTGYELYKFSGNDVLTFLQGQTTADLRKLKSGQFLLNTRLERTGQVKSYFIP